jgi:hypothetical protein
MDDKTLGRFLSQHKRHGTIPNLLGILLLFGFLIIVSISIQQSIYLGVTIPASLIVSYVFWKELQHLNARIIIYEHGMMYTNLFGQQSWRWNDFDGITSREVVRSERRAGTSGIVGYLVFGLWGYFFAKVMASKQEYIYCTYRVFANKKLVLTANNGYKNIQVLGNLLREITCAKQLPGYLAAIKQGEVVQFAHPANKVPSILVAAQGIQQTTLVPWQEISSIFYAKNGDLVIKRYDQPSVNLRVKDVLNTHILMPLIQDVMKSKGLRLKL